MLFDDIAIVYREFSEYAYRDDEPPVVGVDAAERLEILLRQFDALAPDWTEAPEWAQWYAIDPPTAHQKQRAHWYENEPELMQNITGWSLSGKATLESPRKTAIPLGIDWRLCKWQRP